jgi:ABC-type sugar transport system ATPase subunit
VNPERFDSPLAFGERRLNVSGAGPTATATVPVPAAAAATVPAAVAVPAAATVPATATATAAVPATVTTAAAGTATATAAATAAATATATAAVPVAVAAAVPAAAAGAVPAAGADAVAVPAAAAAAVPVAAAVPAAAAAAIPAAAAAAAAVPAAAAAAVPAAAAAAVPAAAAAAAAAAVPAAAAAAAATAAVSLRSITKSFPGVRALSSVTLDILPGEILGLVGENGAGKSTLIKILGGAYPHTSFTGEVVVDGRARAFRSTRDARAAGISVVHQELSLVPEMSVADNLLLGREPMTRAGLLDLARGESLARQILTRVAGDTLAELDLATPVGRYGVGVQQIIEIARSLGDERTARVVVLDEPTAALSVAEAGRLHELIRDRRAAGTAFVYISHHLDEILAITDRVAVLRDGQLVGVRRTADTTAADLVDLMTGRELAAASATDRPAITSADAAPILAVEHLSVAHPTLRGRCVVDDLSFVVRAGEVVALAGAMGAGRTATLSALFGLARGAVTGAIRVDGATVRLACPRDAIAAGLALVPEDRKAAGLVLGMSVADNLGLAALSRARWGLVDRARVERDAAARAAELRIKMPALSAEVATLSGGNQQKVVLGKWLELAPRVLLLDEPTRGVDVGAKAEIYKLVDELTARGHAVVVASSDLPEVIRLADRVIVLRDGRKAGELARGAATGHAIMALALGTATAHEEHVS